MRKFFTENDPVVPVHHPRILVETAVEQGADRVALLENVGVTSEALARPETRLSYAQFSTLEHNALRLTKNPALGLYAGRNVQLISAGMLGIAAVNSASGLDALEVTLRYIRWLAPGWHAELDATRGLLTVRETIPRGDLRVFATEWFTVGLYTLGATVLGKPPVTEIRMNFPEPPHSALYEEFFAVPVRFGHDVTEADLDLALLGQPLRLADPAMAKLAEQYVASEAAGTVSAGGILDQIRQVLKGRDGEWPDLDDMARILQTSGRSLRRELQRLNTSYQELLDEIRLERAEQLVRHTDLKLERISEQLGFSDVRSFRRAFKRWTGRTPTNLRGEGR